MNMEKGKHGFEGKCAPQDGKRCTGFVTFSVRIFEWVPKARGKKLKKSPAKVRVQGYCSKPEEVYAKARELIKQLDAGTYTGPKTVRV